MERPAITMPATGDVLGGRYQLVEEVGRGGFGVVFRATQSGLDQDVAIKVVRPHVLDNESLRARFQREVQIAKQLRHPNTVRILDVADLSRGDLPFYVMEYLEGQSLADLLERDGALSIARTSHIAVQILKGLAEAHAKGVVHRDLKPENVYLCNIYGEDDFVKILDFGIATTLAGTPSTLTKTHHVMGTPYYMSPEQAWQKKELDGRSDLYAVGLIMAECLTGERVVRGDSALEVIAIHGSPEPLPLSAAVSASPLGAVIQRAVEKEATRRFADARAMMGAIANLTEATGEAALPQDLIETPLATPMPTLRPPASQTQPDALLAAAQAAMQEGQWKVARDAFAAAIALGDIPEALFGMAMAQWWLGEMEASMASLEKAYPLFRRRPDPAMAAVTALQLSGHSANLFGNMRVGQGWLARAGRLIDEFGLEPLRGHYLLGKSKMDADPAAGEALAREALEISRRLHDNDTELCAMAVLGSLIVAQGRVDEGLAMVDEAMAAALGGEASDPTVVVMVCCCTINSCTACADFERAAQWIRESRRFAEKYGCPFLNTECRLLYSTVLVATGEWERAEQMLESAVQHAQGSMPVFHARSVATLVELRLAQGRIDEAERRLEGLEGHPATAAALARLYLMRGKAGLAAVTAQRRLDGMVGDPLERGALLEILGEAELAQSAPEAAADLGRELTELGKSVGCKMLQARGDRLHGQALDQTDATAARRHFDQGLSEFMRLGMPYDAARTRLALAESYRDHNRELAAAEGRTALATFRSMGAQLGIDQANVLLNQLAIG